MPRKRMVLSAALLTGAFVLAACSEQNTYEPPPPPKVDVALPVKQNVTPYLETTGTTASINSTALVARVQGFIQSINYRDGDAVKAGTVLFVIEPEPYQLALDQANAAKASADAALKQSQAEFERQKALVAKTFATQQDLEKAEAARDANIAAQQQATASIQQAELNLSYTQVKAPFDGVVTARLVSVGELVGPNNVSTLASIVQFNPIYVDFNVSEKEVLRVRATMQKRGVTTQDLKKIPVEIGLQTEKGYPHVGALDYAAPIITANTGQLAVRGVFDNENRQLLPGYFVRVRVPLFEEPDRLLVPDRAVGSDQSGRYVLIAGKDDIVEQRTVQLGQLVGELRVVSSGVTADDRVVVSGLLTAIPGQKIEPHMTVLTATAADGVTQ
ncbi:efflux RND transporter periplasmic adaptor subunit [Phyllobacterium sp. SYP-B3895]|uniref:efflux RND transporter periplasmic adaptor subunit n=1 Tax=Phyllobacterium sp. SYP-B3895 TaxID=2663240 RepID=UPI0012998474|nr:efflux RND transporter periplasmic adaptor subunit [Phyllobacterium sp. SYP-B3895]MRG58180.1 efflux RND transporter periplasmic adaptor subunit [Phyllobacterium sp. SYP-B3895]